ncbi:hypothetical protein [Botrimarina mediterranea]|uniref:hypothetical protein n=1 Tax=Botrimarina mediterranea TaxID=2528022 RepID=UPI00118B5687|nr:hypothetical protein K2D_10650 [Planctomycetes bacterium K2D]
MMSASLRQSVMLGLASLVMLTPAWAQEAATTGGDAGDLNGKAQQTLQSAQDTATAAAAAIDQNAQAQEIAGGVLAPIYHLAEAFSFPAFHWVAFCIMTVGVVSFALQLTLGKLVVLTRGGFSLSEILSDAVGLIVSLVGLVLTTQAATQNSTFTQSSFSVLSSAGVGVVLGLIFYLWGQRIELQATKGRRVERVEERAAEVRT